MCVCVRVCVCVCVKDAHSILTCFNIYTCVYVSLSERVRGGVWDAVEGGEGDKRFEYNQDHDAHSCLRYS